MEVQSLKTAKFKSQINLPGMGETGMRKLQDSIILVVGLGGGGCVASHQLAMSNIGELILCDGDTVSLSNLGRQYLHHESTLGIDKVTSAKITLRQMNPEIKIKTIPKMIDMNILQEIKAQHKQLCIFTAIDKWAPQFTINRFCIENNIPAVHIGSYDFKGFIYAYHPDKSKTCLRCTLASNMTGDIDPSALDSIEIDYNYLSPVISIVSSIGVLELIKILLGINDMLISNKFCVFRGRNMSDHYETSIEAKPILEEIAVDKNPSCKLCQKCVS